MSKDDNEPTETIHNTIDIQPLPLRKDGKPYKRILSEKELIARSKGGKAFHAKTKAAKEALKLLAQHTVPQQDPPPVPIAPQPIIQAVVEPIPEPEHDAYIPTRRARWGETIASVSNVPFQFRRI